MVHEENIPPSDGTTAVLDPPLHPKLQSCLELNGLWPLYSHQAEAIEILRTGDNIIVATPSASGKSLCYNLAIIDSLLSDRSSRALCILPTKALAQDQFRALELLGGDLPIRAAIFDGDTPYDKRATIKRSTQVLLTNPDMLHLGILPNHKSWSRLFQGLKYVVLDEAHVYRGVFGSHMSNLIRRLRRVCKLYGSAPQFILCSATIGNPGDLAHQLIGSYIRVIDRDGSPHGGRRFVFWNPPFLDQDFENVPNKGNHDEGGTAISNRGVIKKVARRSANYEAATLFAELVGRGIRTINFVRTRKVAELVCLYAKEQLAQVNPALARRISPYRASYLPEDRRRIEKALFDGELLGVSATNALELGIDVGGLDATIITGYPGSVASTWQQAGRSGRAAEESLSVLVGQNNPLDQYLMNNPHVFFDRPVEVALLSPNNPHIIQPHLLCAAYESPLTEEDESLFGPSYASQVESLERDQLLRYNGSTWHLSPDTSYPAETVNIRSNSHHSYLVVEQDSGVLLETVDEDSALFQLHPGAVYLHQGEPYLVSGLDHPSRIAQVKHHDGSYYTQSIDWTGIGIVRELESKSVGSVRVYLGEVEVTNHTVGFKKKVPFSDEVIGEEPLDLPPRVFSTVALWFDIPDTILESIKGTRLDLPGGLHALEHAAIGVLPLFALCDRNDIGGVSTPFHPDTRKPQVFIYDGHQGGIGISERGYQIVEELWKATLEVIYKCECSDGCPSCIQSPKCGNNNHPLDKQVAIDILRVLCTTTR